MLNNVTLIGYLGADAQSYTIRNNSTLTYFRSRRRVSGRIARPANVNRRPFGTNASR